MMRNVAVAVAVAVVVTIHRRRADVQQLGKSQARYLDRLDGGERLGYEHGPRRAVGHGDTHGPQAAGDGLDGGDREGEG